MNVSEFRGGDMNYQTVSDMFLKVTGHIADKKDAYLYKHDGKFTGLNHLELREQVELFFIGLRELGIHKNDRVGIISENRIEWIISSLALSALGAVDVPLFPILTSRQEEKIFSDCAASAVIVSNNFQLRKVLEFKERLDSLRHIIVMNTEFDHDDVFIRSMDSIIQRGREILEAEDRKKIFESSCRKVQPDDLLTLIYTSGTTGDPKGVMLTHRNVITNVNDAMQVLEDLYNETALSFLPFCHSYERTTGFYTLYGSGTTVAIAESIDTVAANIREVRPTMMTTVPRLMETVKNRIISNMEKESASKKKIFNWALKTGKKYARAKLEGKSTFTLAPQYKIADKLVFSKIRERLGGRLQLFISGGAALSEDVEIFFKSMGIDVMQGYGLTEAAPLVAVNHRDEAEPGTVGKPLGSIEIKMDVDGEILVKGDNIMQGYWNNPRATAEAISEGGWLRTGDVGIFTEKGNLKITDRKKYIFVNSGGKNIAPQPIESVLCQSKYIEHCILLGDKREYVTALLTPHYDNLKLLAQEFGISYNNESELISNTKIINHIKKDLDWLQKDFAKFERVRKFKLLSQPFTVESGELSPKMSVKRHIVENKYSELIEAMYTS
ncbi:MAG: AMP-dependent synthetase/ligase [Candidatus Kapaibacterium sp.]